MERPDADIALITDAASWYAVSWENTTCQKCNTLGVRYCIGVNPKHPNQDAIAVAWSNVWNWIAMTPVPDWQSVGLGMLCEACWKDYCTHPPPTYAELDALHELQEEISVYKYGTVIPWVRVLSVLD